MHCNVYHRINRWRVYRIYRSSIMCGIRKRQRGRIMKHNDVDNKILEAVKEIQNYCKNRGCETCILGAQKFCRLKTGSCPAFWNL